MDKKLTLRLDEQVIKRAKKYAKRRKTSLSKMIEAYLDGLTRNAGGEDEEEITPLVKSLSGVIDLSAEVDYKKEYREYIEKKYQ